MRRGPVVILSSAFRVSVPRRLRCEARSERESRFTRVIRTALQDCARMEPLRPTECEEAMATVHVSLPDRVMCLLRRGSWWRRWWTRTSRRLSSTPSRARAAPASCRRPPSDDSDRLKMTRIDYGHVWKPLCWNTRRNLNTDGPEFKFQVARGAAPPSRRPPFRVVFGRGLAAAMLRRY
jgi:hypothetical protein